jgi:hypothetical protein
VLDCPACGYGSPLRSLRGRKLYALDRELLLDAASAGDPEGRPAFARTRGNSDRVMLRRSIAKLQGYGLLDRRTAWLKPVRAPMTREETLALRSLGTSWVRMIRRTPLGDAIVREYRKELEEPGRPIRWDARLNRALAEARAACEH